MVVRFVEFASGVISYMSSSSSSSSQACEKEVMRWNRSQMSSVMKPNDLLLPKMKFPDTKLKASDSIAVSKTRLECVSGRCVIWVHLEASICTEWEQNSMVLTTQGHSKASVGHSTMSQKKSSSNSTFSIFSEAVGLSTKCPKTIHRCILKRVPDTGRHWGECLKCHVCDSRYTSYNSYYNHLIDSTCESLKKVKDATPPASRNTLLANRSMSTNNNKTARPLNLSMKSSVSPSNFWLRDKSNNYQTVLLSEEMSRNSNEDGNLILSKVSSSNLRRCLKRRNSPIDEEMKDSTVGVERKRRLNHPKDNIIRAGVVSLVDHAADEARLANLKVKVMCLMATVMGEDKLVALGYPERDILEILSWALLHRSGSPCCFVEPNVEKTASALNKQGKLMMVRRKIEATVKNVQLLLDTYFSERKTGEKPQLSPWFH